MWLSWSLVGTGKNLVVWMSSGRLIRCFMAISIRTLLHLALIDDQTGQVVNHLNR